MKGIIPFPCHVNCKTHRLLLVYVYHSQPLEQRQLFVILQVNAHDKAILVTANCGQMQSQCMEYKNEVATMVAEKFKVKHNTKRKAMFLFLVM